MDEGIETLRREEEVEERFCAGCGVRVVPKGRRTADSSIRWGHPIEGNVGVAWTYCCQMNINEGKLISADYHYVEGETQVHWPPPKETP